jgi:hypothetical protein
MMRPGIEANEELCPFNRAFVRYTALPYNHSMEFIEATDPLHNLIIIEFTSFAGYFAHQTGNFPFRFLETDGRSKSPAKPKASQCSLNYHAQNGNLLQ